MIDIFSPKFTYLREFLPAQGLSVNHSASASTIDSGLGLFPIRMSTFIVALFVSTLCLFKLLTIGKRDKNYPPGPPTVPVLGNLHLFPTKKAYIRLTEWSRIYSDIYSLMIGSGVMVVISSYHAVKELLDKQGNLTGDRPQTTIGDTVTGGLHMAQAHDGDPNLALLRKTVRTMLTVQKCAEHLPIQRAEAIQFMYDILKDPTNYHNHAERYTYSVISSVTYGIRAPSEVGDGTNDNASPSNSYKQRFYHVTHLWSLLMEPGRHPPIDLLPSIPFKFIFKHLIPETWPGGRWRKEAREVKRLHREFYFELLERVEKRLENGKGIGAFMEQVVIDSQKSLKEGGNGMSRDLMAYLGGVLLEGGSDTTACYLKTLQLAFTAFPDALKKAQEEMDRIVGNDRIPEPKDIEELPYIRAIIKETQRWRPPAPTSLPHAATSDAHYKGYVVPQGSTILLNMWAICHDEALYEDPERFWPDRYIKSEFGTREGVDVSAFRHTLHFGSGRRICPGLNLANNSIEINTMLLVWAFDFGKAVDPITKRPIEVDIDDFAEGLFIAPNPFPCNMRPRSPQHAMLIEQALQDSAETFETFETDLTWGN
ncbi:hypothetical protein VKT23_010793 [Stygiomarasmius scandens]|uniref:Cytochrome P450 n=1 Tax=Marasmiellus scandens TaxID=2682957 RepID=A0ABR1JDK8_9AGAR